jgi:hypothetical protein
MGPTSLCRWALSDVVAGPFPNLDQPNSLNHCTSSHPNVYGLSLKMVISTRNLMDNYWVTLAPGRPDRFRASGRPAALRLLVGACRAARCLSYLVFLCLFLSSLHVTLMTTTKLPRGRR